jgi:hypothetical protein
MGYRGLCTDSYRGLLKQPHAIVVTATGKFCGTHPSVLDCANGHQEEDKDNDNEEQADQIEEADKAKACCQR